MKRIFVGLIVMVVSEIGMLLRVEPFGSWHTPIAWTGYIAFVDGVVYMRRGNSWLSDSLPEFALLAAVSLPLWLVFEFYNLFIHNWHYINLSESPFWRGVGYVWAFATIWPAIFETSELVASLRKRPIDVPVHDRAAGYLSAGGVVSVVAGAAMLAWPLVRPSRYLAAPVWLGFIFLLDPLNALAGGPSLTVDRRRGRIDRAVNLMAAGLFCGFMWEFWNYWALRKWIYTVPILEHVRVFEMPLAGYMGFPAFALECFTMYVAVRLLLRRGGGRPIAL